MNLHRCIVNLTYMVLYGWCTVLYGCTVWLYCTVCMEVCMEVCKYCMADAKVTSDAFISCQKLSYCSCRPIWWLLSCRTRIKRHQSNTQIIALRHTQWERQINRETEAETDTETDRSIDIDWNRYRKRQPISKTCSSWCIHFSSWACTMPRSGTSLGSMMLIVIVSYIISVGGQVGWCSSVN